MSRLNYFLICTVVIGSITICIPYNESSAHTLSPKAISLFSDEELDDHSHEPTEQIENTDPRNTSRTLSTFPEWYIVYSAQEYSDFAASGGRPSQFPYFAAISQYWDSLNAVKATLGDTEIDAESLSVLQVIGISFTVEYGIIGIYEKTIGRIFELVNLNIKSSEDLTTEAIAMKYSESLLQTPWYDFPYQNAVTKLWQEWNWSSLTPRGLERRIIFSLGYHLKGAYAAILGKVAEANFGYVGYTTSILTQNISEPDLAAIDSLTEIKATSTYLSANAPRYRSFTAVAKNIASAGGEILKIQNNDEVLISFIALENHNCPLTGTTVLKLPILTHPSYARFGQLIKVTDLSQSIRKLAECDIVVEHIYDY